MSTPTDLRFTTSHEWVRVDGTTATVGITHFAQESLGDVVYVDMPEEGDSVNKGDEAAEIESVKAVSNIYAPVSGSVAAVNADIEDGPEVVNSDCYGEAWLFKITMSDVSELDSLMDAAAYDAHVAEQG